MVLAQKSSAAMRASWRFLSSAVWGQRKALTGDAERSENEGLTPFWALWHRTLTCDRSEALAALRLAAHQGLQRGHQQAAAASFTNEAGRAERERAQASGKASAAKRQALSASGS